MGLSVVFGAPLVRPPFGGPRPGTKPALRARLSPKTAGNDGSRMTTAGAGSLAQRRFREIVPPLLDDAYTLAKWLCRNGVDAEDIVQEAAMRALKALETTAVERPKPWFLMIVRNAAMTWMERNRPQGLAYVGDMADLDAIDPRLGEAAPDPEETLIALEDGEGLRRAIAALPARCAKRSSCATSMASPTATSPRRPARRSEPSCRDSPAPAPRSQEL